MSQSKRLEKKLLSGAFAAALQCIVASTKTPATLGFTPTSTSSSTSAAPTGLTYRAAL